MTEQTLARARAGDEDAFHALTVPYQRELQLHIYRIVGSAHDAEDLLQETLLAAWRGLEGFEGRASVRAWLYRIATHRSLDSLRAHQRRPEEQRMTQMPEPTRWNEPVWLQPEVARAYALFVLTLAGDHIAAITWFADSSVFPQFGLPRTLR